MQLKSLVALTSALLGSAALTPVTAFAAPPTCSQLATNPAYGLAGNVNIWQLSQGKDNQGNTTPSATIVPASGANNGYCLVEFQYTQTSPPLSGYATGDVQTIGIAITLPLNSTDGGTPTNSKGYSWTAVNGAWNGKIENMGGGGFAGTYSVQTTASNTGYVGSSTDGGHNSAQNGNDGNFGFTTMAGAVTGQLMTGKANDMAYESVHQQYLWALAIANAYYGTPATRNYWNGCSTGGRQGLTLAQNVSGQAFDGILVGSPVVMWDDFDFSGKVWGAVVNRDYIFGGGPLGIGGTSAITTAQFQNAVSHAIAACDVEGTDVVQDGVVDDPLECMYKAETDTTILTAPNGTCTGATCLNLAQAQGVDKIWQDGALEGGDHSHSGARFWYGLFPTILSPSGGTGTINSSGVPQIGTGSTNPERVYDWDHRTATGNVQNVYASRVLAENNAFGMPNPTSVEDEILLNQSPVAPSTNTDGSTSPTGSFFQNANYQGIINNVYNGPKHGKIVLWEGWNDTNPWPQNVIRYYSAVATLFGDGTTDFPDLWNWFRYYHAPGVGHCGGDVGASPSNVTATVGANPVTGLTIPTGVGGDGFNEQIFVDLVNWVENGAPPYSGGDSTRIGTLGSGTVGTRPVCPYPTTAVYNGNGPTNVATSYHCGGNLYSAAPSPNTNNVATACKLVATAFGSPNTNVMNYQELGLTPSQCPSWPFQVSSHDFSGDGASDVLWRDNLGNVGLWFVSGKKILKSTVLGNVPTTWSVVGQRDFTGNGYADILWRDTSGNVGMWLMNGTTVASTSIIGNVPTTWSIVGTGNFNNNGVSDILWEDNTGNLSIWFMNGATISQVADVGNVPLNWSVAGTDSRGDIFWRNTTTGDVAMWVMNGATVTKSVDLGVMPLTSTIAGIGDFDGNGSADILWRDNAGNVSIWLMNGTQILQSTTLGNVPLSWTIAATGDYSGSGKSGILWTDMSGDVGVWFMNGTTISSTSVYGNVGTSWNVQTVNAD
jgi:tannase/feruloyl esterase/VCBS repeat protein